MGIAQLRAMRATEQEQHAKSLRVLEEQQQASVTSVRRAEARVRQLEDDLASRERETEREQADAERRHQAEVIAARADVEKAENDAEVKRQAWREREASLIRQLADARSRAESLSDELAQLQLQKEELRHAVADAKRQEQQREQVAAAERDKLTVELNGQRERAEKAEVERAEYATKADALSEARRQEERRADALQTELSVASQRHDDERIRWAREADDAYESAVQADEQRRTQAMQKIQEDHRKQLAKQQSASKKALQKVAQKYQSVRAKCQELAKRLALMQHEKDIAVRICEENKGAYELRLAELGLAVAAPTPSFPAFPAAAVSSSVTGLSAAALRADSPGAAASRVELQGIADRLERHQEWLRLSRASSIGLGSPTLAGTPGHIKDVKLSHDGALRSSSTSNPQGR